MENMPYGLKELHIRLIYKSKRNLHQMYISDSDEIDDDIDTLQRQLPFGCKLNIIKKSFVNVSTTIETSITRDAICNNTMAFTCINENETRTFNCFND